MQGPNQSKQNKSRDNTLHAKNMHFKQFTRLDEKNQHDFFKLPKNIGKNIDLI